MVIGSIGAMWTLQMIVRMNRMAGHSRHALQVVVYLVLLEVQ